MPLQQTTNFVPSERTQHFLCLIKKMNENRRTFEAIFCSKLLKQLNKSHAQRQRESRKKITFEKRVDFTVIHYKHAIFIDLLDFFFHRQISLIHFRLATLLKAEISKLTTHAIEQNYFISFEQSIRWTPER